jgi:hypothetical protein
LPGEPADRDAEALRLQAAALVVEDDDDVGSAEAEQAARGAARGELVLRATV